MVGLLPEQPCPILGCGSADLGPPQPLGAVVTVHVLHRSLDDPAPVAGGVDDVATARVYGDVGYDVAPSLLEEDQVAGAEIAKRNLPAVLPLFDRVIGQVQPLSVDQ